MKKEVIAGSAQNEVRGGHDNGVAIFRFSHGKNGITVQKGSAGIRESTLMACGGGR